MKRLILFFVLLTTANLSYSQSVISLFNKSNSFFTMMEGAKYDSAHLYFDVAEQTKITPEALQKLWTSVKANFGETEYIEAVQSKAQGESFAVTSEGKFERMSQTFVLVFNKAEKIIGFYMPKNTTAYSKPFYVDTALFSEKALYLKSGTHQLAAMVTTPKNMVNFPMVVLVHGSGPSDMDGTVGTNKPLKDVADGLASMGIGSVRYVKRTVIYPGEFTKAFTVKEEVTDDALAAIALAKTVKGADLSKLYLFGHSLGGMLAPRIASLAQDLKGIILAAAPARSLTDLIIEQNKYLVAQAKDTTAATKKFLADAIVTIGKSKLTKLGTAMKPEEDIIGLPASYWIDINAYNQVAAAQKLTKRIFVVQGGRDFQVSEIDFELWKAALAGKTNAKLKLYPEINHLLSPQIEKGTTAQYQVPVNVSEQVVKDIANWIKEK